MGSGSWGVLRDLVRKASLFPEGLQYILQYRYTLILLLLLGRFSPLGGGLPEMSSGRRG